MQSCAGWPFVLVWTVALGCTGGGGASTGVLPEGTPTSSDSSAPSSRGEGGTGSGDLSLTVTISTRPNSYENATAPDRFETDYEVVGAPAGAVVTVRHGTTAFQGPWKDQTNKLTAEEDGSFAGQEVGIDVEAGASFAKGSRVRMPDLHVFSSPPLGSNLKRDEPLEVTWTPHGADVASMECSLYSAARERLQVWSSGTFADEGHFTIPAGALVAAAVVECRLTRTHVLTLGGTKEGVLYAAVAQAISFATE